MLLTGVSWQIWVFLATAFPTVWLVIHSTEIPQPSLNHPSTSPRPLDFYQEKEICSWLSIFRHFMSTSNLQEQGDVRRLQLPCWSRRGQTYWVGPVSTLYCSTSFSEPSNPLSSCLSLETAGRNKCKCFCKQTQIRLKCNCSVTVTCLSLFQCL